MKQNTLICLLLLGCASTTVAQSTEKLFETYEVITGPAQNQVVLPGSFLGGAVLDLAVASFEPNGDRRLRIFAFEGDGWEPRHDVELRRGTLFVEVLVTKGRDRLLTYQPGRLSWFDPDAGKERTLLEVDFDYSEPPENGVLFADIANDLNDDGLDDLLLPGIDGFQVIVQKPNGAFADPVKLGPPEPFIDAKGGGDPYSYRDLGICTLSIPWYMGRAYRFDWDLDGRRDLVFWNEDHFDVHLQDERGTFAEESVTFTTDVAFDGDGEYSAQYLLTFKDVDLTSLEVIGDLNGDRVADLVTKNFAGPEFLKCSTNYRVHFGEPGKRGVVFTAAKANTIPFPSGARGVQTHDLDGDGRMELKFTTSGSDMGDMTWEEMFQKESFLHGLPFHCIEDGAYSADPAAVREYTKTSAFAPPVLIGDVTGDGHGDLLIGKDGEELRVFLGVPGPGLFAEQPRRVAVALAPDDESSIDYPYRPNRLVDLNGDGKQDLLIHHYELLGPWNRTLDAQTRRPATEPHSVTLLIAR